MLIVVVLIIGVFLGAFLVELLNRRPNIGSRARHVADDFRRGFSEGYRGKAYNQDEGG